MRLPQPGFVCVLFNPAFPDLVRILRAHLRKKARTGRSSRAGSVRRGFTLAHEEWVGDAAAVERRLHQHFAKRRVARRPGFFRVPVAEAVRALKATGGRVRKAKNHLRFQPSLRSRAELSRHP
jgi:hypothetical protein